VLRFAFELLPCLLIGLLIGRVFPSLPGRLAPPLIHWGVPLSLVGLLLRSGLKPGLLISALMALLGSGLGLLLLQRWPALRRRIPNPALRLGSVTGNTAYWGLPVALALLPPQAIGHTIIYDLVGTLLTWSVGPLLIQGIPASGGALLTAVGTSPASRGLALALLFQLTPWREAIGAALWLPARILILVALTVVGMRLGVMLRRHQPEGPMPVGLGLALLGKLLLFPALMLLVALLLGLPPLVRAAVVLQAAAPTAISVLLLAEVAGTGRAAGGGTGVGQAGAEQAGAAALVLGSTVAGLVTVPLWWLLLERLG